MPLSARGKWEIDMETPIGTQKALLEISEHDGALSGQTRSLESGEVSMLSDVAQDGNRLTWKQSISKPMQMHVTFDVTIDGERFAGKAKPGMFPAAKVTGRRVAAE